MARQYGEMTNETETGEVAVVALELEQQQQQQDPHVHITKNPRNIFSRCTFTRTCLGIATLCTIVIIGIIVAILFIGIVVGKNEGTSNAVITKPDDPNNGGLAGNGTSSSSSGSFINSSSSTGSNGGPTSYIPAAPLSTDRCTQTFPQSTSYPWVSTATCNQCTAAGCGWCTIPVKQSDGTTRYYTSCREKNANEDADIGGVCDANNIPAAFKAFPAGKSTVFANAPSAVAAGLTCRSSKLAEHPSTPSYPPRNDPCHTLYNERSCSACVDYTFNSFTITTTANSTCGWLTLPITIDGVTRWYTSCRTPNVMETNIAKNIIVNLPNNKTKIWAQNPIGSALPNIYGSCRETALADAPYTPAPYLAPAGDVCSTKTTCGECGSTIGCGWCSTPKIDTDGSVTVISSCRAGNSFGSDDGVCTRTDPRVPVTWWGYNIYKTWIASTSNANATCPPTITQNGTSPSTDHLDNTPALATTQNYVFRSTLGCQKITTCDSCLSNWRCGWCGYRSTGRCVPTFRSYGVSTTGTSSPTSTGTKVDYSPLCAAPDISLQWTSCGSVPTLTPPPTPKPNTTTTPTTKAPTPTPTPTPTLTPIATRAPTPIPSYPPGPTGPPFIPAAPLASDRCAQAFPQSTINSWVSTTTCDQCTAAGCGWCTMPVRQADGSTRYFTSCREKNAAGTADIGGFCDASIIPTAFKGFPAGKSTVFANAPSSATSGFTCRAPELAEHPSTPLYPPTTDTCHTLSNGRSCSACLDYTNDRFTNTSMTTTKCGWLTLPIIIDGVTRWYTSCRNATAAETITAKNTPVDLPNGKTKIWAQNPIGAALPNTIGSCRESALADAPYTPAPYLAPASDVCMSKTTCGECGSTTGCGWCSTPVIGADGIVNVVTSCRAGTATGSLDGACIRTDPRVPATWWGYNIYQTWVQNATCPQPITQNGTTPSGNYLDNTPALATTQNYVFRSTLGCPAIATCSACLQNFRCGWCGPRGVGRCVPTYRSYGGQTTGVSSSPRFAPIFTGTNVDYSPSCAAPDVSLEWVGCSTVPN